MYKATGCFSANRKLLNCIDYYDSLIIHLSEAREAMAGTATRDVRRHIMSH